MISTLPIFSIYDLSNPHFSKVVLTTRNHKELKGQFVQFKVVKDRQFEFLYPAEKYCFLPEDKSTEFWASYRRNNGEFADFPTYVLQLGLDDIRSICITPLLSV